MGEIETKRSGLETIVSSLYLKAVEIKMSQGRDACSLEALCKNDKELTKKVAQQFEEKYKVQDKPAIVYLHGSDSFLLVKRKHGKLEFQGFIEPLHSSYQLNLDLRGLTGEATNASSSIRQNIDTHDHNYSLRCAFDFIPAGLKLPGLPTTNKANILLLPTGFTLIETYGIYDGKAS